MGGLSFYGNYDYSKLIEDIITFINLELQSRRNNLRRFIKVNSEL